MESLKQSIGASIQRLSQRMFLHFLWRLLNETDHPDLTELSVDGTLLFGDEGMGIARKDMPQIPGKQRARFLEGN
jgi:hypothetical protein